MDSWLYKYSRFDGGERVDVPNRSFTGVLVQRIDQLVSSRNACLGRQGTEAIGWRDRE